MSDERREVIVRRAEQADIEGLVACSSALFAEDAGTRDPSVDINWPREHGPQRFASGLADPNRLLLVADRGESMYVRPAYRRDRIGRRMVDEFRSWAKESSAASAQVTAYVCEQRRGDSFLRAQRLAPQSVTLETAL